MICAFQQADETPVSAERGMELSLLLCHCRWFGQMELARNVDCPVSLSQGLNYSCAPLTEFRLQ